MVSVAYDRSGAGPPLLLIHGLGGERHIWRPVLAALEAERDTIRVDLPGFGESPVLPGGEVPTATAMAVELGRLLDTLGIDRLDVAGNSLGAWVALELAKAGRALSVTCIAPAGLWAGPLAPKPYVMRGVARTLGPALALVLASPRVRAIALAGSVAHPERVPAADARRIAIAYAKSSGFVAANDAMRAGHFTGGGQIDVPVTIAWCERDRLISRPRKMPLVADELVLQDCGHVPMYDDPAAVAGVLLAGSAKRAAAGMA
jgi:pimeloyl-ACP methyl ester carboxylesterase